MRPLHTMLCALCIVAGLAAASALAQNATAPAGAATKPATSAASNKAPRGNGTIDHPAAIYNAKAKMAIDGDLSEWESAESLPAPQMKKDNSSVKMAWNADGLYGEVTVKDKDLTVNAATPWSADAIELFIEKDCGRSGEMTPDSVQIVISPNAGDSGKCDVIFIGKDAASWAPEPKEFKAVSKKIKDGYVVEFFMAAEVLKPAVMKAGTQISLNAAIDNDGAPQEQLFGDKDTDSGYMTPSSWGVAVLAD